MRPSRRLVIPAAVAALLLVPTGAVAQEAERTLSVVGDGRAELVPDRGSFSVEVQRTAKRAPDARSAVNRRIAAIVRGLRAAGVPKSRIRTTQIGIFRNRDRKGKDGPVVVRFTAGAGLSVTVDGVELVARAIDVASDRGATSLFGPRLSFTPDRRATGAQAAEEDALDDARERAEAAAAVAGQQIVGVQSIDLDPGQSSPFFDVSEASGGQALDSARNRAPTKILPGKRAFTSQARVTYIIEPLPA